jgi:uncharacterized protein YbaA (DUF1428 family)
MTVVSFVAIHPKEGAKWDDLQKHLKKGCDLARKHGAENVTTLWNVAGGTATGTMVVLSSTADWTSYGKVQESMLADAEMQALMSDPKSPVASWETYLSQTIPDI